MSKPSGVIFVISAASGCGKTSLIKALLERDNNLVVSISHTTRQPRPHEQDGVHYHFISHQAYQTLLEEEAFVETAEVFDYHYATSKTALVAPLSVGHDVLLDIDWQGAHQVKNLFPGQVVMIFLLPPSKDALRDRLQKRGQDSDEIIDRRMVAATSEMSHYGEFDYVVVNDDFECALSTLHSIIVAERQKTPRVRNHNEKLLSDLLA